MKKRCTVEGCQHLSNARGLCRTHYARWKKHGDTETGARNLRHGHAVRGKFSPEYQTWRAMISRCEDPKADRFQQYGGRGISICDRWRNSFQNFLADMGQRPAGTFIERIDVNGNYEPGNCKWETQARQARNKSTNKLITFRGETRPLIEWSEKLGINYSRMRARAQHGFPPEAILSSLTGQAFREAFPRNTYKEKNQKAECRNETVISR